MATAESSSTIDRSPLWTTQEVARILRVSPRTVRRMGACGQLDRIKFGYRSVRYTPESVEALIRPDNDEAPAANRRFDEGARCGAHGEE